MSTIRKLRMQKQYEYARRKALPDCTSEMAVLLGIAESDIEFVEKEINPASDREDDRPFRQIRVKDMPRSDVFYREWELKDVEVFQQFLSQLKAHTPNLKMLLFYDEVALCGPVRVELYRLLDRVFHLIKGIDLADITASTEESEYKIRISATERGAVHGREVYYVRLFGECWLPILAAMNETNHDGVG